VGTYHKKRVPEDLMGAILGAGSGVPDEEQESAANREAVSGQPTGATVSWEESPERVGVAFNLSKQVSTELDRVRLELEDDTRPSKSEIAEVAFRIAIEDVRSRGRQSELIKRLEEIHATRADGGQRVERIVDQAGSIIETTYGEGGEILDEDVVGSVADLPVEAEYVDEQGRLVSLTRDELGNAFEQVLDDDLNPLETRLLGG
jgi:hypothetical protein